MRSGSDLREKIIRYALTGVAGSSLLALAGIVIFLFMEGLPLFAHYSVFDFLFGRLWYPTEDPGLFGIFPLLLASLAVTALSSLLAVPMGVLTAVYLTEIAHPTTRRFIKPFVELLAALPSVVLGFLGMVILAPWIQDVFNAPTGLNLLNASLVLALMSVPTICSISEDALYSVPRELREASLALGATRWQTTLRVVIPAALSGIGTAVMLGMSRAIGETMVVLMAAGGAALIPASLLDPVRPMPASIAAEMAEAPFRSDHYHALFAIGIVLFFLTLAFNLLAGHIAEKHRQAGSSSL
ncbi:phosphate ABC transporter permease subunit PstC [Desulfovibrio sp. ZJ200]|uniref:phosphate ABC transporter permease subunit PstC n=1 Tax=Desulfovibrio sp. ZJ200 TaxID=2709792 RepID=UPI0013EC8A22|nr:phosphate ABC transporter permease subunit PstC [Desulfovibrio sp. ZJ200]